MKTSIPRIRAKSVKLKNGASLHVLRNTKAEECSRLFNEHTKLIGNDHASSMAGFAVVAWGINGSVSSTMGVMDARHVGYPMLPDFVRSVLINRMAGG